MVRNLWLILLLNLCLNSPCFGAIALGNKSDGDGSSYSTSATVSHVLKAGADFLVTTTGGEGCCSRTVSSCTWNGNAMNLYTPEIHTDGATVTSIAYLWDDGTLDTGTHDIVCTYSGNNYIIMSNSDWSGVAQEAPEVMASEEANDVAAIDVSITTQTNNAVAIDSTKCSDSSPSLVNAGTQTEIPTVHPVIHNGFLANAYEAIATAGAIDFEWTFDSGNDITAMIISLEPSGGAPAATSWLMVVE